MKLVLLQVPTPVTLFLALLGLTEPTPEDLEEENTDDEEGQDADAGIFLSGYPLVDRFPDLDHDLAEPECGCCHCDMSDKPGTTTSEPDMVLYSDRTSDTLMGDCKYSMGRQDRDTGYNFWEVED